MSTVIEELVNLSAPSFHASAVPTWGHARGVRSMGTLLAALFHMTRRRAGWQVAHVHLSERGSFVREGLAIHWVRLLRRPVVATLHGASFAEFCASHPRLVRTVLRRANHILCLGDGHARIVRSLIPTAVCSVMPNPVPRALEQADAERWMEATNRRDLVFLGEVGYRKGIDLLMRAWDQQTWHAGECELRIAGPLAVPAGDLSAAGASYVGSLDRATAYMELQSADAVALISRAEVLPMVVIEALACGARVVLSEVGEWRQFASCPAVETVPLSPNNESETVVLAGQALGRMRSRSATPRERREARAWILGFAGAAVISGRLGSVYHSLVEPMEN